MKKHILLIEDNNEIRENTAEILELANYAVTAAANGKQGVEMALNNKPDLIICDIMMPVLDGYGVLHLIHKNPELSKIPFIFLTAKSERTDFRKGMEMGADDYITKPFSDIELLNAIDSRIKKSEVAVQQFSSDEKGINDILAAYEGNNALENLTHNRPENNYRKKTNHLQQGQSSTKTILRKSGKSKNVHQQ